VWALGLPKILESHEETWRNTLDLFSSSSEEEKCTFSSSLMLLKKLDCLSLYAFFHLAHHLQEKS
jgi:hypothetical protein